MDAWSLVLLYAPWDARSGAAAVAWGTSDVRAGLYTGTILESMIAASSFNFSPRDTSEGFRSYGFGKSGATIR